MNPHAEKPISPMAMTAAFLDNRSLIYSLVKREVVGRYRGSMFGLLWSLFNPVVMLFVYTFVFSVVFKARWQGQSDSNGEFALILFAGLMVFNLFSECVNTAPKLILANINYVKKVIFPLEILPLVSLGSAFFHFVVSVIVWFVFYAFLIGMPQGTALYFPVAIIPIIFVTLGVSWFLASLGVYLRDVSQMIGVLTTILMFMTPIFYPVTSIPPEFRWFMEMTPLTYVVEKSRDTLIWGSTFNWESWAVQMSLSLAVAWFGFAWFQKTRKGFADVI